MENYQISDLLLAYNTDLQDNISSACVSIYQCNELKSPELITIECAYGMDAVLLAMRTHLVVVSEFVGAREKMTDWQINALCSQLYGECPTLTLTEFILFCARLRAGKYESFYGSVDPQKVIVSFGKFLEDRKRDYDEGHNKALEEERLHIEKESKPCSHEELMKMVEDGKLPNLAHILKNPSKNGGKYGGFYYAIQKLMNFKQNNS